jgi:hypothetical protein
MFFTIFQTLVQVAFFFFILTAAFTLSFYTIFQTFIYPDDANFYDGVRNAPSPMTHFSKKKKKFFERSLFPKKFKISDWTKKLIIKRHCT